MKIQFIGATHEVTGSCTLLTVCGKYYLVDCGMEQGRDVFKNIDLPVARARRSPRPPAQKRVRSAGRRSTVKNRRKFLQSRHIPQKNLSV